MSDGGEGDGSDFGSSPSSRFPSSSSLTTSQSHYSSSSFFDGGGIGRGVAGIPAFDAVRSRPCTDPDAAAAEAACAIGTMVEREEALARRAALAAAGMSRGGNPGERAREFQYGDEEEGGEEEDGGRGGGGGGYF